MTFLIFNLLPQFASQHFIPINFNTFNPYAYMLCQLFDCCLEQLQQKQMNMSGIGIIQNWSQNPPLFQTILLPTVARDRPERQNIIMCLTYSTTMQNLYFALIGKNIQRNAIPTSTVSCCRGLQIMSGKTHRQVKLSRYHYSAQCITFTVCRRQPF